MGNATMVVGSKGGVGKTTVCLHLAQALMTQGGSVVCLDADASTKTLAAFKALKVEKIEVLEKLEDGTSEVQEWRHSAIYDHLTRLPADTNIVIDTGASNYQQALAWLLSTDAFETMQTLGWDLHLHTVIGGGADFRPSLRCLKELSLNFPNAELTVWLNPHGGILEADGRRFEETRVYAETKHQIASVVHMPRWTAGTRTIVENMLSGRQTYEELLQGDALPLWDRPRLRRARQAVFEAIELARG